MIKNINELFLLVQRKMIIKTLFECDYTFFKEFLGKCEMRKY